MSMRLKTGWKCIAAILLMASVVFPVSESLSQSLEYPSTANGARKTHFALGEKSPGLDVLTSQFQTGQEPAVRASMAADETVKNTETNTDIVSSVLSTASKENRPLNPNEQHLVKSLANPPPVNPDTVLESAYGNRLANTAATHTGDANDPVLDQAMAENQSKAYAPIDAAAWISTKQEIAHDNFEKAKKRYEDTSWGKYAWDVVKTMVPLMPWYDLHNILKKTEGSPFLAGNNMADQLEYAGLLPPDEYKEKTTAAINWLMDRNVVSGLHFAQALVRYTAEDKFVDNGFEFIRWVVLGVLLFHLHTRLIRGCVFVFDSIKGAITLFQSYPLAIVLFGVGLGVIGLFLSSGYIAQLGILGSLSYMDISIGLLQVPFRWVLIVSASLALYGGLRLVFLRQ